MVRRAPLVLGGLSLGLALLVAVRPLALGEGEVLNLYTLSAATSAVAMVFGLWRWRPAPVRAWLAVAVGVVLWVVADVAYLVIGGTPAVSSADVLYLLGYVAIIAGVARLVGTGADERDLDNLIDMAVIFLAAMWGSWDVVVGDAWATSGLSGLEKLVLVSYPILDAALLVLVAELVFGRRRPSPAVALLAAGLVFVFVGDLGYAILQQTDSFQTATLLDSTWPIAYALVALAALQPPGASSPELRPILHPARLVGSVLGLASVPLVATIVVVTGSPIDPAPLAVASAAIVGLVLMRLLRLYWRADTAAREVERSRRYFRGLAMNSTDAYVVIDDSGVLVDASPGIDKVIGWSRDYTVGKPAAVHIGDLIHPDDAAEAGAALERARALPEGESASIEVRLRHPDGTLRWVEAKMSNLLADPAVRGLVVNVHDVDMRKRAEEELIHQAVHDPLTGLANRLLLRERLERSVARCARGSVDVAVLFCDLDGFKAVNDTLGHAAGDELLRVVAARLRATARDEDTVARLGGDEFAVVIEGAADVRSGATVLADRLLAAIAAPIDVAGTQLVVTASIGVAIASVTATNAQLGAAPELLRQADIAMYDAKSSGRNCWAVYDRSMNAMSISRLSLTSELLHAVARDELVLHYQPVVELATRRLTGFEALVRWQHPIRGLLLPSEFIPMAEESGLILDLGRWVLGEACRNAASWPVAAGGEPITIAVNVSGRQVDSAAIVDDVREALAASGLDPGRLVVELTESTLVAHPETAAAHLSALRGLGVRIAIDDFGTGYSSLSYLRRFPIDILKIDQSFVQAIEGSGELPAIVRGLVDLGRTLELETIAEGIEHPDQWASLADNGCAFGQGFLFSRPVDHDEARGLACAAARSVEVTGTS